MHHVTSHIVTCPSLFQARKGDGDYLRAFYDLILPIALEFQPELVFVSAGFDSGLGDPLVSSQFTSDLTVM